MGEKYKLTAPDVDQLIGCYCHRIQNPEQPSAALMSALDPLFRAMADLAPDKRNNEAKGIWITVPRGEIRDWMTFKDARGYEGVKSKKEYEELWRLYHPFETEWYFIRVFENKPDSRLKFRGLSVTSRNDYCLIINADLNEDVYEGVLFQEEAAIELCRLLLPAVEQSMEMLRDGTYNDYVANNLPYPYKTGVVARKVEWEHCPQAKENILEGLADDTLLAFRSFIQQNSEDVIGRMRIMTANDFFKACAIGYRACGYKGTELTPVEQYLKHADGRDEGLTGTGHGLNEGPGIDFDDPKAWDQWYFDRNRAGGHPWEVCRGGNSTHIDLFVYHDEHHLGYLFRSGQISEEEYNRRKADAGYYFVVRGNAWTRSVEAVNFFVAIREAGYPVILEDAEEILARFDGTDLIGIVPHHCLPCYCESLFPAKYGTILDFIHVDGEDMENYGDQIEWLPEEPATLLEKEVG